MNPDPYSKESTNDCMHPYIRKGYYLGLQADVFVCISCGEQRPAERWENFELRRAPPRGLLNDK
jgi:hypothetical protein